MGAHRSTPTRLTWGKKIMYYFHSETGKVQWSRPTYSVALPTVAAARKLAAQKKYAKEKHAELEKKLQAEKTRKAEEAALKQRQAEAAKIREIAENSRKAKQQEAVNRLKATADKRVKNWIRSSRGEAGFYGRKGLTPFLIVDLLLTIRYTFPDFLS